MRSSPASHGAPGSALQSCGGSSRTAQTSSRTVGLRSCRGALGPLDVLVVKFEGGAGRVVLVTSGAHLAPMAREVAYAVSKGALALATTTLADELADRGIIVNCINPGPTDTGWGLAELDPARRMPFGRWGEPDDAARLVAWLCSDDGRWVTGQVLDSEGGFRRWA